MAQAYRSGLFKIGQRVSFHCQWPYCTEYGIIVNIRENSECGWSGMGADIRWEKGFVHKEEGTVGFVPFWNNRLKPED